MADKTVTTRYDDMDDSTEGIERYSISFLGKDYEIDLGPKSAKKLLDTMDLYLPKARELSGPPARRLRAFPATTSERKPSGSGFSKEELQAVRAWAAQEGITVAPKGRIKAEVLAQYEEAHAS
ncbi:Lsr2 family protein [Nakamurella sp. PAMC28650]|uniref:histone-like nucleoid-structuring protein Lsr2 n=1 Tax=Nakamurella sp. PAMC28650 TaxID=2762325 RepID=UPI00164DBCBB|nr:Lsr2 family protein [Nakamurella sp. PAMC28650]QNK82572.1 Lsr2 family protein [Nakamurella sp. PAMC28650]